MLNYCNAGGELVFFTGKKKGGKERKSEREGGDYKVDFAYSFQDWAN